MKIFSKWIKSGDKAKTPSTVDVGMSETQDQLLKRAAGMIPKERLLYLLAIQEKQFPNWSSQEKALCYEMMAEAAGMLFPTGTVRLAFLAAQLFYDPDPDSTAWKEFIDDGYKPSETHAELLHRTYPLPISAKEIALYQQIRVKALPKEGTFEGKKIRHIVCLCYDMPEINNYKKQMQEFIINAENQRGNELTFTSRITFDSFYDNSSLTKPEMIRQKLQQIYATVYQQERMYELADKTVTRETQYQNGHILVIYLVLYE